MDRTTKILAIGAVAAGAYLLYAKQSSATPFSFLPRFQGSYLPQALRPATDSTLTAIALGGSAVANLLPRLFQMGNNALAQSGGVVSGPDLSSYAPYPGYGVLLPPNTGQDWILAGGQGVLSPVQTPIFDVVDSGFSWQDAFGVSGLRGMRGLRGENGYDMVGGGGYIEPFSHTDDYDTYDMARNSGYEDSGGGTYRGSY